MNVYLIIYIYNSSVRRNLISLRFHGRKEKNIVLVEVA